MASTDLVYFASGHLDAPGAMFTASHNPAQYNGIKLCREGAAPVGAETGLDRIKAAVASGDLERAATPGRADTRDLLGEYVAHVHSFVDLEALRPLRVVADTANGVGRRRGPRGVRRPAVRAHAALRRARRHVPEPSR